MDPYQRAPRSPRGKKPQPFEGSNPTLHSTLNEEGAKSPTSDQVSLVTRKPVFLVFDQVRLKPVCSATEAS